jgi:hypothetical protein
LHVSAARIFVNDAGLRVEAAGRQALATMLTGAPLTGSLDALRRLVSHAPVNTTVLRRQLADDAVARGAYPLG